MLKTFLLMKYLDLKKKKLLSTTWHLDFIILLFKKLQYTEVATSTKGINNYFTGTSENKVTGKILMDWATKQWGSSKIIFGLILINIFNWWSEDIFDEWE